MLVQSGYIRGLLGQNIMDGQKIRVLIIDDHDMVRHGLKILLQAFPEFEVVGDTDDARLTLALCATHQPDIVLMDVFMPQMDGVVAARLVHEKFPSIRIIALTSTADEDHINDMLRAGAISYILKTGSIDDVANAIRSAYHGKATLAPEATRVLISTIHHPAKIGYNLSRQELKVLALLVEGLNNREIADRMVVSQSTVKAHVGNIFAKLNTNSRTKAITIALRHQLIDKAKQ
jgi:NarL family two-component system response regulator LiaR